MHKGVIILCFINQQLQEAEPSVQKEQEQHAESEGPFPAGPRPALGFHSPLTVFMGTHIYTLNKVVSVQWNLIGVCQSI